MFPSTRSALIEDVILASTAILIATLCILSSLIRLILLAEANTVMPYSSYINRRLSASQQDPVSDVRVGSLNVTSR